MKRDANLLRKILLEIESNKPAGESLIDPKVTGYDPATIGEHIELLKDDNFIEAKIEKFHNIYAHISIDPLTSKGYDFIQYSNDNTRWNSAKNKIIKDTAS